MLVRSLSFVIAILFVCSVSFSNPAGDEPKQSWTSDISNLTPLDRPVPIPWGARLPFPWTIIQGTWMAERGEFKSYFAFQIVKDRSSKEKQILVKQIDAVTCDVIATGTGIATNKTVSAQMRNIIDGRVYSLSLSSFQPGALPEDLRTKSIEGQSILMSITVIDSETSIHYLGLQKMTNKLDLNCELVQASY